MRAEELNRKYCIAQHMENGTFIELGNRRREGIRDAHGAIYYYVPAGERTAFHCIDCDEYWCYHTGTALDVCIIKGDEVSVVKFGAEEDASPLLLFKKGAIFAAKSAKTAKDGTFMSCVTVPRFSYDGFTIYTDEEIKKRYPRTATFFED